MEVIIVAANKMQYLNFIRNKGLKLRDCRLFVDDMSVMGLDKRTPVLILEEYQYNRNCTLKAMEYIGKRFHDIHFVSERAIYSESFSIRSIR